MCSHVDFIFWLFLDGLLLLTSTPRTWWIQPPLQREHDLSKNRFSQFVSIFHWFWCHHAFVFLPKIHLKCIKLRLGRHQFFHWFLHRIFYRCSVDLGGQLGAMLAPKTRPRRLQEASKTAPKTKCETLSDFARILIDFGSMFDGFLVDVGLILAWFLVDFPSIFGQVSGWCFARFLIKCSTIFDLLARFLVDCSSAVAGTQLCCALDTMILWYYDIMILWYYDIIAVEQRCNE